MSFFLPQEDTLACVLALDGFYHDGRNIRASYGTSKYCSAFIKTVRCNNPDCTYLHHMGDAEDTFTKQEIQAGYVTSGRDVAERQQQIMAQQTAAVFGTGANVRKKVGGGGPSGMGKESKSPIFPPPTFDEPLPRKPRAQSAVLQQRANMQAAKGGLSAASIVAGVGATPAAPPAQPHTTLTSLTPLKRGGSMPVAGKADLTPAESLALQEQRKEALALQQKQQQMMQAQKTAKQKQQQQQQQALQNSNSQPGSPNISSAGSGKGTLPTTANGVGGSQIGGVSGSNLNMGSPLIGSSFSGNLGVASLGGDPMPAIPTSGFGGSGILGGQPIPLSPDEGKSGVIGGASLGAPLGSPFGVGLLSTESSSGGDDKWGSSASGNETVFGGSGALWGGDLDANKLAAIGGSSIGGGDVGGMSLFGTNQNSYSNGGGGSSALASMLGIQLPTGSGSLSGNSSTFPGENSIQAPIRGLNASNHGSVGAIGASKPLQPIGAPQGGIGGLGGSSIPISGFSGGGGNSDMALLQSLLPGVNITSDNGGLPQQQLNMQPVGVGGLNSGQWQSGGNASASSQQQQNKQQDHNSNIW